MHANAAVAARQRQRVQARTDNADAYSFFNLLTGPRLLDEVASLLSEHRERALLSAVATHRDLVDVHGTGALGGRQLPASGQRCGGQADARRPAALQQQSRRPLQAPRLPHTVILYSF
jgi:hypothetical protein